LLCYKCGSHVPDSSTACSVCGHKISAVAVRQVSSGYSRRATHLATEGGLFKREERIAERYIVRELLGEGPTGFSYGVYDDVLKVNVRLKVIHPNLLQTAEEQKRFSLVLERISRLTHPNLSRVFEIGNARGRMFYTQQLAEGLSLRRIIDERLLKGNFFSYKEVEPIFGQLVQALEVVHTIGPHLNLKPENIFVLPDLLKLTDVGLGLAIPRLPFVQAQRIRREESYFAPEFLSGMEAGGSADIYSLGVILGEMLAGILPEGGGTSLNAGNAAIPVSLEVIYRKAIAESTLVRHRSIAEFYNDFSAFYKNHERENEGRLSLGASKSETEHSPSAEETVEENATPRVAPSEILNEELESALDKRSGRFIRWGLVLLGVVLAIGLFFAFRGSEPDEYTGRNVGGFVQPSSVAPVPTEVLRDKNIHTEEVVPQPSPEQAVPTEPPKAEEERVPPPPTEETLPKVDAPPQAAPVVPSKETPSKGAEPVPAPSRANVPPVVAKAGAGAGGGNIGSSRCPEQMRRIPSGSFRMGTGKDDPYLSFEDLPVAAKEVEGFCIDVYEYPNRSGQVPQMNVSWDKAKELCQKQGKRLCTEAEWEKACRGKEGLRWPYGNVFDDNLCNSESTAGAARALAVSGKFSRCLSPYEVFDMSGNVAEWTEEKVVKGGSFLNSDYGVRCAARKLKVSVASEMGFRCCANLK